MANLDRYLLIRGPASLTFTTGAAVAHFESVGDIVIDPGIATAELDSAGWGILDEIKTGAKPVASFRPLGMWRDLAVLFPWASMKPGTSLVGALNDAEPPVMVDNELLVQPHDTNQQQYTFHGVALSKPPTVRLSATEPLFSDDMQFSVYGKNNVAPEAANRLYTAAANTLVAPYYDRDALIVQRYDVTTALLNAGVALETAAGVSLALNLRTEEKTSNGRGPYDLIFRGVQPVATLTPVGVAEADLLAALKLQGAGSGIGHKLSDSGEDLVIEGTGVYCKIPLAGIRKAAMRFGATADRLGDLDFVGAVTVGDGGAINPRFIIDTAAP